MSAMSWPVLKWLFACVRQAKSGSSPTSVQAEWPTVLQETEAIGILRASRSFEDTRHAANGLRRV